MDRETLRLLDDAAGTGVKLTEMQEGYVIPEEGDPYIARVPVITEAILTGPVITEDEADALGIDPESFPNTTILRRKP